MFPRRYFPGRYFAPRYFPESQGGTPASDIVPDIPGLEYTANGNRMHYVAATNRVHYTTRDEDK